MSVKLLTEHHLELLSLKGGYTGSSESTIVKCHIVGNHVSRLNYEHDEEMPQSKIIYGLGAGKLQRGFITAFYWPNIRPRF